MEAGEAAPLVSGGGPVRTRSRSKRQQNSIDSTATDSIRNHGADSYLERNDSTHRPEPKSPRVSVLHDALNKELESIKSQNAWYASELALARKAGYNPSSSSNAGIDGQQVEGLADDDRPLIEALLSMRSELAKMQATVDTQSSSAARKVADIEHQRDAAINEAAYARAKLAAHGGVSRSVSQSDSPYGDAADSADRDTDISRRLALALAAQSETKAKMDALSAEMESERRARQLAEGSADAAHKRVTELEQRTDGMEVARLQESLHEAETLVRNHATARNEAESSLQLLQIDKQDLTQKLEDALGASQTHAGAIVSLREAVSSSSDKAELLQQQLITEREQRDGLEKQLLQVKNDHTTSLADLEATTRRLRSAEEIAESHRREADTHKQALLSGLTNMPAFNDTHSQSITDQRVTLLQKQVDEANTLTRSHQEAADAASLKLRKAEERIAGLEAYQEQTSREGLQVRRQLQAAVRDAQALSSENNEIKQRLETHQRDANALAIQHGALKDLLGERGINPNDRRASLLDSPGSRFGTPEQSRLRELEQQLSASMKAHEDTKAAFESRHQETDRSYREKLEQLENDYQSAVVYVKGTEKMLKRMKDELSKYRTLNARLQSELDEREKDGGENSGDRSAPADWETERQSLQQEIENLHRQVHNSVTELEMQMQQVRHELSIAQNEREQYRLDSERAQQQVAVTSQKSLAELEQLKRENQLLETRAQDAEQKVTILLDQVESSVDNYRRQSQHIQPNGLGHNRGLSDTSNILPIEGHDRNDSVQDSTYSSDNRNSVALDSLASELETLRSHWETNRNYRLSSQFDFERTPTSANGDISDSLASWRKKLDQEEDEKRGDQIRSPAKRMMSPTQRYQDQQQGSNVI